MIAVYKWQINISRFGGKVMKRFERSEMKDFQKFTKGCCIEE